MSLPRLLNPVPVFLRQIGRSQTAVLDDDLHEPVGQAHRDQKPVELVAQVKEFDSDNAQAAPGGVLEQSRGYLLFRCADLKAACIELQRGDRIVQIGDGDAAREVDLYFVRFQHRGHYARAGGYTLVKAWFADRHPSKQRGDL